VDTVYILADVYVRCSVL